MKPFSLFACLLCFSPLARAVEDATPSSEQLAFFEKKIRPVLAEKCYKCHSQSADKIKGGLVLDSREGIRRGGDNGPAVVPGNLSDSLLVDAIRYANKDTAMPPENKGGKLPEATIKDLEEWVKMGAPDPRAGAAKLAKKAASEESRNWWAFQPVQKPQPAQPHESTWARSEIDRLVLAGLEAKNLKPVADADPATLLRRLYFDLIGLPPSPQQMEAFLKACKAAPTPQTATQSAIPNPQSAIEKVVDELLASPRFGERWGRHWLDVTRYAESSGKDNNVAFPHAWRYRDYVIESFNADKPYNEFLREQIAGDLLPAKDDKQRAAQLIATGFLAIGTKGLNEQNPRQFALDLADEQIDTVSQAILGLTVACARCHDHKFDPIPQREYYAMAGIFLSTETRYGTAGSIQNRHASELVELPPGAGVPIVGRTMLPEEKKRKETQLADLKKEQSDLFAQRIAQRQGGGGSPQTPQNQQRFLFLLSQVGALDTELKEINALGQPKALAMGVCDYPAASTMGGPGGRPGFGRPGFGGPGGAYADQIRARVQQRLGVGRPPEMAHIADSAIYTRGDADKPGEKVPRGFVSILSAANAPSIDPKSSGRRELADWLTSPTNPLTARVWVNREWHWLFGRGVVESTDNFGTTGAKPDNQALLDYLAGRFVENGWSMKKLLREIVLSRTYQLGSTYDEKNFAADPENTLMWRMSKRRLDAECIRDAMLSVSGQLDLKVPLASLIAQAGEGPIAGRGFRQSGVGEERIINASAPQRSVYLPVARDVLPDALAVFDFAEPTLVTGTRETTNVPSQALYLLNSPFVESQARAFAQRLIEKYPGGPNAGTSAMFNERLALAYWLVFARAPEPAEVQAASTFLNRFPVNWNKADKSSAGLRDAAGITAAWTSLGRALFASAEFRYLN